MTDLERARMVYRTIDAFGWDISWKSVNPIPDDAWPIDIIAQALAAGRREGVEEILSSLSHPNRSALRENVRENLEQQYANIFGKRCSTDAARRLAECALETAVAFLVRALTPEEPT